MPPSSATTPALPVSLPAPSNWTGQVFDLLFADPPYGDKNVGQRSQSFAQQLLDDAQLPSLLADGGLFILGHARRDTLSLPAEVWTERKVLQHGDNVMRFLGRGA
jgi:16S rRNA G966 N2-methylase RsmD